mmetsp:Transcript_2315/g.8133  ORF Transcript_2315/g.8133 Transcript_2315/m.8133 type:complete len:136 (+) Transcript_2315:2-409(+)
MESPAAARGGGSAHGAAASALSAVGALFAGWRDEYARLPAVRRGSGHDRDGAPQAVDGDVDLGTILHHLGHAVRDLPAEDSAQQEALRMVHGILSAAALMDDVSFAVSEPDVCEALAGLRDVVPPKAEEQGGRTA